MHSLKVIELNDENFESELQFNENMIILFYSNSFNNSKIFLPKFEEFAHKIIEHYSGDMKFGQLNSDKNEKISQKYHIVKVPVIKYMNFKGRVLSYDVNRKRDIEKLILWYFRVTDSVIKLNDFNDVERLRNESVISLVLFGNESNYPELFKIYKKVSNYYEFHYFFFCDNANCSEKLNGNSGQIFIYKPFDEIRNEIQLNMTNDNETILADLIVSVESFSREIAPIYNEKLYEHIFINRNPGIFLYSFKNDSKFSEYFKIFSESARENRVYY